MRYGGNFLSYFKVDELEEAIALRESVKRIADKARSGKNRRKSRWGKSKQEQEKPRKRVWFDCEYNELCLQIEAPTDGHLFANDSMRSDPDVLQLMDEQENVEYPQKNPF